MEMIFHTDFQSNADYFTNDLNYYARILKTNEHMVAGQGYQKIKGVFQHVSDFLMPAVDLSDFLDEYNEQLAEFEDEFWEEGDLLEEDLDEED